MTKRQKRNRRVLRQSKRHFRKAMPRYLIERGLGMLNLYVKTRQRMGVVYPV